MVEEKFEKQNFRVNTRRDGTKKIKNTIKNRTMTLPKSIFGNYQNFLHLNLDLKIENSNFVLGMALSCFCLKTHLRIWQVSGKVVIGMLV